MNHQSLLALASAAIFAVVIPGLALASPYDPAEAPLPYGCEDALRSAHAEILGQRETIGFLDAIALVQDVAGSACRIDVHAGLGFETGQRTLAGLLEDLEMSHRVCEPPTPAVASEPSQEESGTDGSPIEGGGQGCDDGDFPLGNIVDGIGGFGLSAVACTVPGAGGGTIKGSVLGIQLGSWEAVGEWEPAAGGIMVNGDAGILGGTQTGPVGVIRPLLPAMGSSAAYCNEIKNTTVIDETCWWLVVWWKCTQKVETSVSLQACGATARQSVLGIAELNHKYSTATPCT